MAAWLESPIHLGPKPNQANNSVRHKVDIGRFTMIPRCLFGSGAGATLGVSAGWLYVALCERANRSGRNVFNASDESMAADTGLGTRTICDARKRLTEYKLIDCRRVPGRAFTYTLLPQAFEWKQVDQRRRAKRRARGYGAGTRAAL